MRTARILGWGREPRTTEFAPPPRGAFFLMIDWAGCIIVTSGLPDPDQLFTHPYICMPDGPRSLPNENLRAPLKATLNRIQALFSIRSARGIAPFSTRMRFWRDTPLNWTTRSFIFAQQREYENGPPTAEPSGETIMRGRDRGKRKEAELYAPHPSYR